jgi:hypothetical protein
MVKIMKINHLHLIIPALLSGIIMYFLLAGPSKAQTIYTPDVLYTIPWGGPYGSDYGALSTLWNVQPEGPEAFDNGPSPGPWMISDNSELVIYDNGRIHKYDPSGNFMASYNCSQNGIAVVTDIAISNSGMVLASSWTYSIDETGQAEITTYLYLFNSNLQLVSTDEMPLKSGWLLGIFPSDSDFFYILYVSKTETIERYRVTWDERLLYKFHFDGTLDLPDVLWSGYSDDPAGEDYQFVLPSGEVSKWLTDERGYTYRCIEWNDIEIYDPPGSLVYTLNFDDEPQWELVTTMANYCVLHSGNFYTLHATDEGAILTKYELNLAPICDFFVVTPMPYRGSSPAAIEFDASCSYDPNPCDELTYEWDFDGDFIFSEPVDDSYTGDPANPTHEYTSDYEGPVNLRVSDPHAASSTCTALVIVDII